MHEHTHFTKPTHAYTHTHTVWWRAIRSCPRSKCFSPVNEIWNHHNDMEFLQIRTLCLPHVTWPLFSFQHTLCQTDQHKLFKVNQSVVLVDATLATRIISWRSPILCNVMGVEVWMDLLCIIFWVGNYLQRLNSLSHVNISPTLILWFYSAVST